MAQKINFTRENIAKIPKPWQGKRVDYQDAKFPSLYLRVSHTGVKTYSVLKRNKAGKLERITLGRSTNLTVEQARKMALEVNLCISAGKSPSEERKSNRAQITFHQLFNEYIERYAKENKKT